MPRCSERALEMALRKLAEHATAKQNRSNWMSTFLVACRVQAAGYSWAIAGADRAARDLFVLLPNNQRRGRINPFIPFTSKSKWLKLADSGRATAWNTGTRLKQTVLFVGDHFGNGLHDDAVDQLLEGIGGTNLPARDALAVLLTRDHNWASEPGRDELHALAREQVGLGIEDFECLTADLPLGCAILGTPEWSPALLVASDLGPHVDTLSDEFPDKLDETVSETASSECHAWTEDVCTYTLREVNIPALTQRVLVELEAVNMVLPDVERLVRRCVSALLIGHLVLQGPPGTGKTTLARILADAFAVRLVPTTATSEWSPYHVVGGFRPHRDGTLTATYGEFTAAALRCARIVRQDVRSEEDEPANHDEDWEHGEDLGYQAAWLFIDEFNRADIDKAIGSLFTVLSSSDPDHLAATPIQLWFESQPSCKRLWVPARFRVIAAMNDLDTAFVNQISQGLARRFQFVTVGVPSEKGMNEAPITPELESAFEGAHAWLNRTYGAALDAGSLADAQEATRECLTRLQQVIDGMRHSEPVIRWPVGTAQIVDVLRMVLLRWASDRGTDLIQAVDDAVADRLVPQMAGISDEQWQVFRPLLRDQGLTVSADALCHLVSPHDLP